MCANKAMSGTLNACERRSAPQRAVTAEGCYSTAGCSSAWLSSKRKSVAC